MDAFWTESKSASPPRRNIPASTGYCLSINSLPQETQPVSNLMASQSFPARRRENKIKIFKIPGHVPGILNYNRASVRRRRARRPMQIPLRAKPALRDSVAKRLFRHAQPLKTPRFQGLVLSINAPPQETQPVSKRRIGFAEPVHSRIPDRYLVSRIRRTLSSILASVMVPWSTAAFRPS